jgi:hypothetical protein
MCVGGWSSVGQRPDPDGRGTASSDPTGCRLRARLSVRGMAPLLAYLCGVGLAPVPLPVLAQTPVERLLEAYRVFLVEERGLAASTSAATCLSPGSSCRTLARQVTAT